MSSRIAAIVSMVLVLDLGAGTAIAKDPVLLSLGMEHFRDTATVKDNSLDGSTTVSSENGFAQRSGPLRMVWQDEFLTSVIDKKTGQKSFQVNAWIMYTGNWRSYDRAIYQTPSGPREVPATKIGKEAANCAVGDCTYTERMAFPVDEKLLRRLAQNNGARNPEMWTYKFIPRSGPEYVGGLSSAEIAGLLAKVDDYTDALPGSLANGTSASLKLDLGIGGMPVAASAQHPNRTGILIIGWRKDRSHKNPG